MNKSMKFTPIVEQKGSDTIFDAIKCMNGRYGTIVTVKDDSGKFSGVVSEGDLRRAILGGSSSDTPLRELVNKNSVSIHVSDLQNESRIHQLLNELQKRYSSSSAVYAMVPVIEEDGRVERLVHVASLNAALGGETDMCFNERTVLVVGGAGYIGSILVRQLLQQGWLVKVLDKLLYSQHSLDGLEGEERFTFIRGDAGVIDDIVHAAEGVDAVVYLAELVGDPACSFAPQSALKTNYVSVAAMAHLCSHLNINRFVYTSSCSVYGATVNPKQLLTEQSNIRPLSLYARVKMLAEKSILSVCQLPDSLFAPTILRLGTVFGHSYRPRFDLVVNTFVKNAIQKGEVEIFGGDQWRPHVYVRDVGEAIMKVLDAPIEEVRGEIFNVGSTRMNHTIDHLGEMTKIVFPGTQIVRKKKNIDKRNYRVDCSKIERVLGFRTSVDIIAAMEELKQVFERGEFSDLDDERYSNYKVVRQLQLA